MTYRKFVVAFVMVTPKCHILIAMSYKPIKIWRMYSFSKDGLLFPANKKCKPSLEK